MRVTLVHNPAAGGAEHSGEHLAALVRAAGHQVSHHASDARDLADALAQPADLLIVAGGDGTVGEVVRKIVGRHSLLAIIPLGTANNIASALAIDLDATPAEHIAALAFASKRKLDVGVARAPWGTEHFIESAGVGCFSALLRDPPEDHAPASDPVVRAAVQLRCLVERAPARSRRVVADGVDLSGDYLLVAALNTPRFGSRFELAPAADPGDGVLELVLIREEDRNDLIDYLARLEVGHPARIPLATRRSRKIELEWSGIEGHLDDRLWPEQPKAVSREPAAAGAATVELELAPSALYVLVPATRSPR